jgi:conjugal transfer pilus assembly protein TraL
MDEFYIPKRLDEPEMVLFWTMDELGIMITPLIVGVINGYTLVGLLAGLISFLLWRKVKGGSIDYVVSLCYWYLPSQKMLNLKFTPPSYKRFFIG